jgi:hypothetical protein
VKKEYLAELRQTKPINSKENCSPSQQAKKILWEYKKGWLVLINNGG